MEKIKFVIKGIEDGWPPVKYENLWGEKDGNTFKVKNAPFFIDNIAFDDVVQIKKLDDNSFDIIKIVNQSPNSTIWIYINDDNDIPIIIKQIKDLKCAVEGGVVDNYYSINIPSSSILKVLYGLLDPYINDEKIMVDYPCIKEDT
ncbi:DUF4265 domain-containing protein [Thalassomonas actiniarum]|uniref:DUF4265 domain-containing protein n=1 Tax=Thalassomonas actiniarum TaxID=485447 RepID=A0AAF0C2U6_9GAMM|nr:DUF4265 domain-containing protein [Thalassomonas actiniarum]WDD98215.1 DUF4265 domain-containing protein [Thalassomonas actiniarum]